MFILNANGIHSISSEGELMLTILASFAQEESLSASENQKWRIKKKFENGEPVGFVKMYGYSFKKGKGEIAVNKEQAAVIKKIFDWYISGNGANKIAKLLNEENIVTFNGGKWSDSRVLSLVRNEKLTGNCLLQKKFAADHLTKRQKRNSGEIPQYFVENTHPAIISKEVFEEAQQIREKRAKHFNAINVKNAIQNRYPFTSKIVCKNCGKHYKRKKTLKGFSWHCSTFLERGKEFCNAKAIPEQVLNDFAKQFGTEKIKEIRVPDKNCLDFLFYEGSSIKAEWQDRSRKESWTPQMREKARQIQRQIKIQKQSQS
jgi:hypothetical protein